MTVKRILGLMVIAAITMGAQDEPLWKLELRLQLQDDLKCNMIYTTNERTLELGTETTLSGRAHCEDGRAFDYARLRQQERFKLTDCQPQVC